MTITRTISEAVELCYRGVTASALKRGRNPRWPYVPVVVFAARPELGSLKGRTEQVRGRAYATRDEAVSMAERQIETWRNHMASGLAEPRNRAFREQWSVFLEATPA